VWEGCPLPTGGGKWGGGYAPSPEHFLNENGVFWWTLDGAQFLTLKRLQEKASILFFCIHWDDLLQSDNSRHVGVYCGRQSALFDPRLFHCQLTNSSLQTPLTFTDRHVVNYARLQSISNYVSSPPSQIICSLMSHGSTLVSSRA